MGKLCKKYLQMNSHWKYAVVSRKRGKNIGSLLESASSLALTSCLVKCSHLHTLYLHAEALIVQVLNPLAERKEKKNTGWKIRLTQRKSGTRGPKKWKTNGPALPGLDKWLIVTGRKSFTAE